MSDQMPDTPHNQPSPSAVPVPEADTGPLTPSLADPVLDKGDRRSA